VVPKTQKPGLTTFLHAIVVLLSASQHATQFDSTTSRVNLFPAACAQDQVTPLAVLVLHQGHLESILDKDFFPGYRQSSIAVTVLK